MQIKTGQSVKVLAGKDKGKTGKVLQVFKAKELVVVDGVNKMFKHFSRRATNKDKGERVEFFGPIHISNVKAVEEKATEKKPTTKKEKKEEAKK